MQSTKKKSKRSKAGRRKRRTSGNNQVGRKTPLAPAGVSMNRRRTRFRFLPGSRPENLGLEAVFPIYTICANTNPAVGVTTYNNFVGNTAGPSGSNRASFITLRATGGIAYQNTNLAAGEQIFDYISPAMQLFALNFVHYKVTECEFIYEPQATTVTVDRIAFGFASDALHPLLKNSDGTQEISGSILALEDSVAFAPWENWRLNVSSSLNTDLLYTYGDVLPASGLTQDQQYTARQMNRFASFGCIAASCSNTSQSVSQMIYGILYMRIKAEFIEFCPLIRGVSSSFYFPGSVLESSKEPQQESSSKLKKEEVEDEDIHSKECKNTDCCRKLKSLQKDKEKIN